MTYAFKIRSSTGGVGEQHLMELNPDAVVKLAPIEEKTHSLILKHFEKDWSILEAGCGLGRWIIYLSDLGYNMHGIDISESAVNMIKSARPDLNLNVGDIKQMPFQDDEFDAVLSDGVVEHDHEGPEMMLREMYRVVKPGGVMIVIVPVQNWIRALIHRPLCAVRYTIMWLIGRKLEFEEYRFSAHDFARRVRNTGWTILEHSWVELTPHDKSYALWVDWGNLFRLKEPQEPFTLNRKGKRIKRFLWRISPWTIAEGIVIVARK